MFDSTGATALPAETLPKGAFALVVREDYVADSLDDLPPAPGTLLLRVPRLGNGLSNSGEALRLEAPGGDYDVEFSGHRPVQARGERHSAKSSRVGR